MTSSSAAPIKRYKNPRELGFFRSFFRLRSLFGFLGIYSVFGFLGIFNHRSRSWGRILRCFRFLRFELCFFLSGSLLGGGLFGRRNLNFTAFRKVHRGVGEKDDVPLAQEPLEVLEPIVLLLICDIRRHDRSPKVFKSDA